MTEDELLQRLRADAGYQAVPLLDPDGYFAGLHMHRFLPGQTIDVVQVWNEQFDYLTVRAQLENSFNSAVPFAPPAAVARDSGRLAEVAGRLLLPRQPIDTPGWPRDSASGE